MSFTFGHPYCPQCGEDVDPEDPEKEQYCGDCLLMFKEHLEYVEEKYEADMMADWEAARYGY